MRSLDQPLFRQLHAPAGTYRPIRYLSTGALVAAAIAPTGGAVLDVGTGVGTIALELLRVRPDLAVEGVDVNPLAVETAKGNAERLGLSVSFWQSDLFAEVTGRYDVITSTIPWIRVPPEGPDLKCPCDDPDHYWPLEAVYDTEMVMARLLHDAHDHLVSDGRLVMYADKNFASVFDVARYNVLGVHEVGEEGDIFYVLSSKVAPTLRAIN